MNTVDFLLREALVLGLAVSSVMVLCALVSYSRFGS